MNAHSTPRFLIGALALLLLFGAYTLVSSMDFEDALREEAHYCRMVESGAWPDYRGIYDETCNEETDDE